MKVKGLGLVLGAMLLFSMVNVEEASANKVSKEEVDILKPLRPLSREAADSIKTVHEKELSDRTVVPREIWLSRKAANSIKAIHEKELSNRTVIFNGK